MIGEGLASYGRAFVWSYPKRGGQDLKKRAALPFVIAPDQRQLLALQPLAIRGGFDQNPGSGRKIGYFEKFKGSPGFC